MAVTHNLDINWSNGNEQDNLRVTRTGGLALNLIEPIPDASDDLELLVGFSVVGLKLLVLSADQDLLLKTNSDSAPDDTVTLTAGSPVIWYQGCGWELPFESAVTALYVTNASGAEATLRMRALFDPTPDE